MRRNSHGLPLVRRGAIRIVAEMIRCAPGINTEKAGARIELPQAPVGTLVEEIDDTRLVRADDSARIEILNLLHGHYPDRAAVAEIRKTMYGQSAPSVGSRLSELRTKKLIFGDAETGYGLTTAGYTVSVAEIERLQS